jgi:biotin operon repressor
LDSLISAAARALAQGDALAALNSVALRDDPPALALRGVAMAQLEDFPRARTLLRRAARGFGARESVARARCLVAEAEIALVSRDLGSPERPLEAAAQTLDRLGDSANAAHARYLAIRRLALIGRLDEAERGMAAFDAAPLPPASRAAYLMTVAAVAIRRLRIQAARAALDEARALAEATGIAGLIAEAVAATRALDAPVARAGDRPLKLDEVEALLASDALVIDACRHIVAERGEAAALQSRPVLFALARALAEAWPGAAARTELLARAFRAKHADDSHRARLRVEIGRLRKALRPLAGIEAVEGGFRLTTRAGVAVLAPLTEEAHGEVLALLADGEAWSSSALALALGASPRTVQRALEALRAEGKAQAIGAGRARRWMTPPTLSFPTSLLLPAAPAGL